MDDATTEHETLRETVLLATLPHVAFDGWGEKALLAGARDAGVAVLLVSSDLQELRELCDRIAVMRRGLLVETLAREAAT